MGISLKELKKNRLSPAEKWVLETIEGVKSEIDDDGNVWWYKDSKWLFTQYFKNELLDVSFCCIWGVLEKVFGLTYDEMFDLLTNLLYDYTDNGKLTVC